MTRPNSTYFWAVIAEPLRAIAASIAPSTPRAGMPARDLSEAREQRDLREGEFARHVHATVRSRP